MTRITGSQGFKGEDDKPYAAELAAAKITDIPADAKYSPGGKQLEVDWIVGAERAEDRLSLKLGIQASNKQPSKLRQMLNALAEKPKDAEVWFDPDTLEWGYDMDGDDSTPAFAKLTIGMTLLFKGENRKQNDGSTRYRITGYKASANGAAPARRKPAPKPELPDAAVVDVDPDSIPF